MQTIFTLTPKSKHYEKRKSIVGCHHFSLFKPII